MQTLCHKPARPNNTVCMCTDYMKTSTDYIKNMIRIDQLSFSFFRFRIPLCGNSTRETAGSRKALPGPAPHMNTVTRQKRFLLRPWLLACLYSNEVRPGREKKQQIIVGWTRVQNPAGTGTMGRYRKCHRP